MAAAAVEGTAAVLPHEAARARVRRRRRILLLAGLGVLVAALVAVALDSIVEYVPAARAVLRARSDLDQAQALLRDDVAHLDPARVARARGLLTDAQTELGAASAALDDGLLARVAVHLPWVGTQVETARALRHTAQAADDLGLDLTPVVGELLATPADPRTTTLARLAATSRDQQGAIGRLGADLEALSDAAGTIPDGSLLGPLDEARALARREVPPVVDAVGAAIPFLQAVPAAVGPGTHTYLVLVANPGEERPGGGYIGAVGEVRIRNGEVVSRLFRDSAFSDRLVRDIPPPRPLADYLFGRHWWELGDANWSPDFPTSAAQVATFYTRATGTRVDGEVEVDPVAFSDLLAVLGPVQVPPWPQTITAANALREINYVVNRARPGDPGKEFLPPFGTAVLDRLLHAPLTQMPRLVEGLRTAVAGKHVVLHFDDPGVQAVVDAHGAGGEVEAPLSDSVLVADANVGGGKGDLFTTRRYDLAVRVDGQGEVHDRLSLTYTSPVLRDPADASLVKGSGGAYRDYLRVYLPEPAHLRGMTLSAGGVTRAVGAESLDYELNRLSVGFLLEVPAGQTATLTLDYDGGFADVTADPVAYSVGWEKQVNALSWPVTVTVSMPDGATRRWSGTLDTDLRFSTLGGAG